MKNVMKGLLCKLGTILKWILWIAGVAFFSIEERLNFVAAFILAVACGFLIKKYVRRIPTFSIPAVCLLAGNVFLLLLKMMVVQEAIALLVVDVVLASILLFWVMPRPTRPGVFWLMAIVLFALLLDFRLFDAFDHTGRVNKLGFDQLIIKFFLLGFLIPAIRKLRRAYRDVKM